MTDSPEISVITVVRNDPEGLRKTIESVSGQTYPTIRQIVIDGASTDRHTLAVLEEYSSRLGHWISEPDKNVYDAMNKGMAHASPDSFIVFLNAGDVFYDEASLSTIMAEVPNDADAFYSDIYIQEQDKSLAVHPARGFDLETVLRFGTGALCHQAFFIKRSLAPAYDIKYRLKAELDWYFKILEKKPKIRAVHVPKPAIIFVKGGLGYQQFIRNRMEWIRVVKDRYGYSKVAEYDLVLYLLKNAKYRYAWLQKIPLTLQAFQCINLVFKGFVKLGSTGKR